MKIEKTIIRRRNGEFCALEVKLEDRDGRLRLSICGTEGRIYTPARARREALAYCEQFFEENKDERYAMNERFDRSFRTAKGAAKFVIESDGEYYGLDVFRESDKEVLVTESCGQICDKLVEYFPEIEPYLQWHLNDMHSECVHQEARGETYNKTPDAVCPDCGYKIGSAWLHRELPAEVIAWAKGLPETLK